MKTIISLGLASVLVLSAWVGWSAQSMRPTDVDQTPVVSTEGGGSSGKMRINFEGRVTGMEDGTVTLDTGKTVLIGDDTIVVDQDGAAAGIAVDNYIQGYATDPDAPVLEAVRILVTVL